MRFYRERKRDVNFGIEGKKYLITGASSGIGQATAILISKFGAKVVLNGRNEERLYETLSQMEGKGHHIMPFDLSKWDKIGKFVKDCLQTDEERFDGLVFASGMSVNRPIRAETLESVDEMLKVNYLSYFTLIKEFSSRKVLNDGGSIVAVSSQASIVPDKGQSSYGSSKAALETLSMVASREFEKRRIRVNLILPGATQTPASAAFFASNTEDKLKEMYPLGVVQSEDIANTALFFLSDMSNKITGQRLVVLGGHFLGPYSVL